MLSSEGNRASDSCRDRSGIGTYAGTGANRGKKWSMIADVFVAENEGIHQDFRRRTRLREHPFRGNQEQAVDAAEGSALSAIMREVTRGDVNAVSKHVLPRTITTTSHVGATMLFRVYSVLVVGLLGYMLVFVGRHWSS